MTLLPSSLETFNLNFSRWRINDSWRIPTFRESKVNNTHLSVIRFFIASEQFLILNKQWLSHKKAHFTTNIIQFIWSNESEGYFFSFMNCESLKEAAVCTHIYVSISETNLIRVRLGLDYLWKTSMTLHRWTIKRNAGNNSMYGTLSLHRFCANRIRTKSRRNIKEHGRQIENRTELSSRIVMSIDACPITHSPLHEVENWINRAIFTTQVEIPEEWDHLHYNTFIFRKLGVFDCNIWFNNIHALRLKSTLNLAKVVIQFPRTLEII